MTMYRSFAILAITMFLLYGCAGQLLEVRRPNVLSREVSVIARREHRLIPGKIYKVFRTETASVMPAGGHHDSHRHDLGTTVLTKKWVGSVYIGHIVDSKTAVGEVVSGDVRDGDILED